MSTSSLPRFLTVSEAAEWSRLSEWTIRSEIKAGRLRAPRIGRCVRVLDTELVAWAQRATGCQAS